MTTIHWIELEVILAIHDQQITEHGGRNGIRDLGLLKSALDRPHNLSSYKTVDVFDLAAEYGYGIACNHPFIDGNKRTAYVTTRLFLRLNNHDISAPKTQRVLIFEKLDAGRLTSKELAAWLRKNGIIESNTPKYNP